MSLRLTPPEIRAAITGRKQQHRVRIQLTRSEGDPALKHPGVTTGQDITLNLHGQPAGTIRITDITRQRLRDLTLRDANQEGYRTRADYSRHWHHRHSTKDITDLDDDAVLERMMHHWGNVRLWVIHFHAVDTPLLLHKDSSRGYTSNPALALHGEGQGVDRKTLEKYAKDAELRHLRRLRTTGEALDALPLDERVKQAARLAADRHVDASSDLRLIRYMLSNDRQADAERKLIELERTLRRRSAA